MSSVNCQLVSLLQKSTIARNNGAIRHVSTVGLPKASSIFAKSINHKSQQKRKFNTQAQDEISSKISKQQLEQLAISYSLETLKKISHRLTQLDPLGLNKAELIDQLLSNETCKLIDELKQSQYPIETRGLVASSETHLPASQIIDKIFNYYIDQQCGLEYNHLGNADEINWLTCKWEELNENFSLSNEQEIDVAKLLLKCEQFDHFLAAKFPTTKRYGCEGAESMLIVFDELLKLAQTRMGQAQDLAKSGISDVIIAMPHRGRLNLLACLLGLDPAVIFNKCMGESELNLDEAWMATGDVLSHLSLNNKFVYGVDRHHVGLYRDTPDPINLSLLPNPSHLEIGSAMCMGAARGRAHNLRYNYSSSPKFNLKPVKKNQNELAVDSNNDDIKFSIEAGYSQHLRNVLSIQVHGDASLAGQGIIQESLQMSQLKQFQVQGSIHLVVNNQIGYTTPSDMGRSSRHCTDVFKMLETPIIHVNGKNIPSVLKASQLAFEYRQKFGKDIALNLICFRRHGHNEMDEPSFTQPLMYKNIRSRQSIPEKYCKSIELDESIKQQIVGNYKTILQEIFQQQQQQQQKEQKLKPNNDDYRNFSMPTEYHRTHLIKWQTGCDENLLRQVGLASVNYPSVGQSDNPIQIHPTLERTLVADRRAKFSSNGNPNIDWATAEMLAIGSLLRQSHSVRLAGQDVARGTFSTRHAVFFDQLTERPYVPLNWMQNNNNAATNQTNAIEREDGQEFPGFAKVTSDAKLEIANTILSEEAALAYEFGYSIETCELSIWEAQFGDFFNTAQSIIDTLISCSEAKWLRQSALTMLLPHGLDGAGPEHSSSRLERFLQLSKSQLDSIDTDASVNWSVCFPTLPSQYFHLLRRQVLRPFRKPLIVMSPKVIFRHPQCQSPLSDFGIDHTFQPVLDDPKMINSVNESQRNSIDTMVLCSGKVYFQLDEIRRELGDKMDNVAIIRLEELCPFPVEALYRIMQKYPNIRQGKLIWFQEEHKNQGAYQFIQARLQNLLNVNKLGYIGRNVSELTATGSSNLHKRELTQLIDQFKSLSKTSSQ